MIVSILVQVASHDHLAHELSCGFVAVSLLFSLLDPASKIGQLPHVCLQLLLLDGLFLLLFIDLALGSSSLGTYLEQACANSFVDYSKKEGQAVNGA